MGGKASKRGRYEPFVEIGGRSLDKRVVELKTIKRGRCLRAKGVSDLESSSNRSQRQELRGSGGPHVIRGRVVGVSPQQEVVVHLEEGVSWRTMSVAAEASATDATVGFWRFVRTKCRFWEIELCRTHM